MDLFFDTYVWPALLIVIQSLALLVIRLIWLPPI